MTKLLTKPLKRGWTTGAMATAATKAATEALFKGEFAAAVSIILPGGTTTPKFRLLERRLENGAATAAVRKDAGDDPDVTHGALIRATVRLREGGGIRFMAGRGVGTVTMPGLPLAVGEPAINPAPRRMMERVVRSVAIKHGVGAAAADITISVPNGERLAAKTWNPRLGIVGGISILGTSGVVVPYSCAAWIASIHQGVDVALAQLESGSVPPILAAATGKTSAAAMRRLFRLADWQLIDMGDFVGGLAKYLRKKVDGDLKLCLGGGFGKLAKLAAGNMDLHSKRSRFSPSFLAELAESAPLKARLRAAHSAAAALAIAESRSKRAAEELSRRVAECAKRALDGVVGDRVQTEVLLFDRRGGLLARA